MEFSWNYDVELSKLNFEKVVLGIVERLLEETIMKGFLTVKGEKVCSFKDARLNANESLQDVVWTTNNKQIVFSNGTAHFSCGFTFERENLEFSLISSFDEKLGELSEGLEEKISVSFSTIFTRNIFFEYEQYVIHKKYGLILKKISSASIKVLGMMTGFGIKSLLEKAKPTRFRLSSIINDDDDDLHRNAINTYVEWVRKYTDEKLIEEYEKNYIGNYVKRFDNYYMTYIMDDYDVVSSYIDFRDGFEVKEKRVRLKPRYLKVLEVLNDLFNHNGYYRIDKPNISDIIENTFWEYEHNKNKFKVIVYGVVCEIEITCEEIIVKMPIFDKVYSYNFAEGNHFEMREIVYEEVIQRELSILLSNSSSLFLEFLKEVRMRWSESIINYKDVNYSRVYFTSSHLAEGEIYSLYWEYLKHRLYAEDNGLTLPDFFEELITEINTSDNVSFGFYKSDVSNEIYFIDSKYDVSYLVDEGSIKGRFRSIHE